VIILFTNYEINDIIELWLIKSIGGYTMKRRSRVEVFNAKSSKKRSDEDAIKKHSLEKETVQDKAEKIAKEHGIDTEEIFAVITRESIGSFINLWNNSMESVIRETMRNEVKKIIQDELAAAYRGILKGIAPETEKIKEELAEEMKEEILIAASTSIKQTEDKVEEKNVEYEVDDKHAEELKQMVIEGSYISGCNPAVGLHFKRLGKKQSNEYQKFLNFNKGRKGAWKKFVEDVLKTVK
jgi:hypothetical protein